jgi:dihydroneopterin aldolase
MEEAVVESHTEMQNYTDKVVLRQIPLNITVGLDAWGREKPQPVLLSLEIPVDLRKAAKADDVSETLDYGKLFKKLSNTLAVSSDSAAEMALRIRCALQPPNNFFTAKIVLPKGNLRAGGGLQFTFDFFQEKNSKEQKYLTQTLSIKGISCACTVGVNPHEREEKQIVIVNLEFRGTFTIDASQERLAEYLSPGVKQHFPTIPHVDVVRKVVTVRSFGIPLPHKSPCLSPSFDS